MSDEEEEKQQQRGRRGPYLPCIVGLLVEYQGEESLSPWKYSSLIPDTILSYSIPNHTLHYDLVVLRFGRPEENWKVLEESLKSMTDIISVSVFRNKKNSNRLHYLKNTLFPKKANKHHAPLKKWDLMAAAKEFQGMDDFLAFFSGNDITGSPWSHAKKMKAERLLRKYNLKFLNEGD